LIVAAGEGWKTGEARRIFLEWSRLKSGYPRRAWFYLSRKRLLMATGPFGLRLLLGKSSTSIASGTSLKLKLGLPADVGMLGGMSREWSDE
jgi:hypothetical protein